MGVTSTHRSRAGETIATSSPPRSADLYSALHRGMDVAGVRVPAGRPERSRDRHVGVVARDVGRRAGLRREEAAHRAFDEGAAWGRLTSKRGRSLEAAGPMEVRRPGA